MITTYTRSIILALESQSLVARDSECAGIGPEGADAIMKQYPTAASLFKKLRQVRAAAKAQDRAVDAACVELLARIPITLSRKVGACAARSIHDVLFAINAENM